VAVFNSDAAVAALLSRDNARGWREVALPDQPTGALLQQAARDNQAANLALAQVGLQQMGETGRTKRMLDYNKWELQERLKQSKRDRTQSLISGLSALSGIGTAGRRLGLSPAQITSVDPNSILQSVNSMISGLGTFGNPSSDYARYFQQAAQYIPGMARTSS
jgi:hypothetical protein